MSIEKFELVQKDSGEIVLQAPGSDEPLLQLRFNRKLRELFGADALALAQAMIESASYAFEYAQDATDPKRASGGVPPRADRDADSSSLQDSPSEPDELATDMIRLRTSPLH